MGEGKTAILFEKGLRDFKPTINGLGRYMRRKRTVHSAFIERPPTKQLVEGDIEQILPLARVQEDFVPSQVGLIKSINAALCHASRDCFQPRVMRIANFTLGSLSVVVLVSPWCRSRCIRSLACLSGGSGSSRQRDRLLCGHSRCRGHRPFHHVRVGSIGGCSIARYDRRSQRLSW